MQEDSVINLKTAELFETRQITLLALKYFEDLTYDNLYKEIHKVIASGNGKIYVVVRNETVIAFAQCELQHDSIENRTKLPSAVLRRVCVDEEWRNKKLGTRLVEKCGKWAKMNGCSELVFDCPEGKEEYAKAYGLLGFSEKTQITRYHRVIN